MAYKNKKKNKRHIRKLRLKEGMISKKHDREKKRNNPPEELTMEKIEKLMREAGMI